MSVPRTATTLATLLLLLAGCGSADPGGDRAADPPPAAAATSAAATPTGAGPGGPGGTAGTSPAGAAVPEQLRFSATTVDGRTFAGSSLAGRPAVLWFWAPWCTVCRGEAPDLKAAQAAFGDRVQFVGVPGLGRLPAMRDFVSATDLAAFPHVVDTDGGLWSRFGVTAQPAFAFVTRDGSVEVVPGALPAADLTARLTRLAGG